MPPRFANSPRPATSSDRHVAEPEEVAQQRVLVEPQAAPEPARLGRQVVGDQRVLQQRLDARDQDARPAAPPRGEGRDAGGRLVGDELAPLVRQRGARLEDDDRLRVAQPGAQLLGDPVADLRVARDPGEPLARVRERERRREVRLRAMRHRDEPGMAADAAGVVVRAAQALAQRRERPGRRQQRRERGQVGQPVPVRRSRLGRGPAFRRRASHPGIATGLGPTGVLGFGIDRGQVEVDRVLVGDGRCRAASVEAASLGQPRSRPRRPRIGGVARSAIGGALLGGRTLRQPVFVRRTPSAPGGPSTSPGAASRSVSAGRSSNLLKWLAALLVPSRAQASTASAAASSSSSSRCCSSGAKRDRTWSIAVRSGSPIPTRRRLNFSVPRSSTIERRPLWPPGPPPSRNRSLPNGSAKSSATTSRSTSGACSRWRTLRTARPESFM